MRVAVAGLGAASLQGHLPALGRLASEGRLALVAAADPNASRRSAAAVRVPGLPLFESTEAMLESVRSDLLVVASQPDVHARLTAIGARHRQHVVCEKPLTLTRAHQEVVARAYSARLDRAIVAVHQYRYSPTWSSLGSLGRCLSRFREPFELCVSIERDGTDPRAASPWRSDLARSGGMLADHGVHFLALGWTISEELEVLAVERMLDRSGSERSLARLRLGSGVLEIRLHAGAHERHTGVCMRARDLACAWIDDRAVLRLGTGVHRWRSAALSDRRHVDALYVPFYRNVVSHLSDDAWRVRQRSEALGVSNALVTLLDRAEAEVRAA